MVVGDVAGEADSRAATQALLGVLSAGRHHPGAWVSFAAATLRRSAVQAGQRPLALAQLTALHAGAVLLADPRPSGRGPWRWAAVSWLAAATHLGMLEGRRSLSLPDALTLGRALLPVAAGRLGGTLPALALASDVLDGPLSRAGGTASRFGGAADFLADTALWTWFVLRHEPDRAVRVAALGAWAAPVAAVTGLSVARGSMVDIPRSRWFRPAAAVQALLVARAVQRQVRTAR